MLCEDVAFLCCYLLQSRCSCLTCHELQMCTSAQWALESAAFYCLTSLQPVMRLSMGDASLKVQDGALEDARSKGGNHPIQQNVESISA